MYLSKIKLVNFIGIYLGQKCETLEIDMDNRYPITLIKGINGEGKSVLLSAISSPFAYDGGFDNRSSTNIIRQGYLGEKEMTYVDGNDVYFIHHFYKPNTTNGHTVKSYICRNGVELNPNGNVSSFEQIIQSLFGIVEKDLMLMRMGTNAISFTSLSSMERKKYLSRIIGDVNVYMQLFAMIQYDIRVNRSMVVNYMEEVAKLNIVDINHTIRKNNKKKKRIEELHESIGSLKTKKSSILSEDVDIQSLQEEKSDMNQKLLFISTIDDDTKKSSVEQLKSSREKLEKSKIDAQNRVNELKSTIDSNDRNIQFSKMDLDKLVVDDSISLKILQLSSDLKILGEKYKKFKYNIGSKEYANIYQDIGSIKFLLGNVLSNESKIVHNIVSLYQENADVESWVDKSMSTIVDPNSKLTMEQHLHRLLNDGYCIPECNDVNCAFRKLGEMIQTTESDDEMTVDFVKSVKNGFKCLNQAMYILSQLPKNLPQPLMDILNEDAILSSLKEGIVFTMDIFDNFRSVIYGYESYIQKKEQLEMYKNQEAAKNNIIQMKKEIQDRIESLTKTNSTLITKLASAKQELQKYNEEILSLDVRIGKRIEYDAVKEMMSVYQRRVKEIDRILHQYANNQNMLSIIDEKLGLYSSELDDLQLEVSAMDTSISLYQKYQSEIDRINNLITEQNKILRNVSVKDKGIPILYMKIFFDKIRVKCNEILDMTFDGLLKIGEFDPTNQTFDIPYIRNGMTIKDVKYASQGEQPVISIALSFAMSSMMSGKKYNILCCDELDSTLDYKKKRVYPEMLYSHTSTMGIEQCFVISHSEVFDTIPTNVIDLNDDPEYIHGCNMYKINRS